MNRSEQILEKFIDAFRIFGRLVDVYENPKLQEFPKAKSIRFIVDIKNKKVYVWDAKLSIHIDIVKRLGLRTSGENAPDDFSQLWGTAVKIGNKWIMDGSDDIESRSIPEEAAEKFYNRNLKWAEKYIGGIEDWLEEAAF